MLTNLFTDRKLQVPSSILSGNLQKESVQTESAHISGEGIRGYVRDVANPDPDARSTTSKQSNHGSTRTVSWGDKTSGQPSPVTPNRRSYQASSALSASSVEDSPPQDPEETQRHRAIKVNQSLQNAIHRYNITRTHELDRVAFCTCCRHVLGSDELVTGPDAHVLVMQNDTKIKRLPWFLLQLAPTLCSHHCQDKRSSYYTHTL